MLSYFQEKKREKKKTLEENKHHTQNTQQPSIKHVFKIQLAEFECPFCKRYQQHAVRSNYR